MVESQESAGIIVYSHDKEIKFLLLRYPSYWGFARGLIEKNENFREAAIRELKEETNIDKIDILPGFLYEQKWFFKLKGKLIQKKALFLLGEVSKEEANKVKISFEHSGFKWVSLKEALELITIKNNKEMIESAFEFINKYESQKRLF